MSNIVYYADEVVQISGSQAIFGHRVYEIADISRARFDISPSSKTLVWWVMTYAFWALQVVAALAFIFRLTQTGQIGSMAFAVFFGCFVTGAVLGIAREFLPNLRYLVTIEGTFGKADVVLAKHGTYAETVVHALNQSIKAHKQKANRRALGDA